MIVDNKEFARMCDDGGGYRSRSVQLFQNGLHLGEQDRGNFKVPISGSLRKTTDWQFPKSGDRLVQIDSGLVRHDVAILVDKRQIQAAID